MTSTLENSLARPDQYQLVNKESSRTIKAIKQKNVEEIYDSTNVFIYGRDNYGDPAKPFGSRDDYVLLTTKYYNDNNEFIKALISDDDIVYD